MKGLPSAGKGAVVGGGLAGLAAALRLAEHGWSVDLFEARRSLGGRAGSFRDPAGGGLLDHCQHVAMGCCTNLADFCHRADIDAAFREDRVLHFFSPEGREYRVSGRWWLPAPLHLAPSLLRLGFLSLPERVGVGRALLRLARYREPSSRPEVTIGQWLREQGQSERALRRFWAVVLVSALSESLDRVSVSAARKVFVDGFMAARRAYLVQTPAAPLGELYGDRLIAALQRRGARVHAGRRVAGLIGDGRQVHALELAESGGERRTFDAYVVAVPWRRVAELLDGPLRSAVPELQQLGNIESAPITAVHLWFDRPVMNLPHAVLVDRLSQWVFRRGTVSIPATDDGLERVSHYYQVVISASRDLAGRSREEIRAEVVADLAAVWPEAARATLHQWRIVTQPEAVFSVLPGSDAFRPPQKTAVTNLFLAGDWTRTGWPATMEGAVRSGYLAAEAVFSASGDDTRCLVPDLPAGWLSRRVLR